jgi:hypothetical protein
MLVLAVLTTFMYGPPTATSRSNAREKLHCWSTASNPDRGLSLLRCPMCSLWNGSITGPRNPNKCLRIQYVETSRSRVLIRGSWGTAGCIYKTHLLAQITRALWRDDYCIITTGLMNVEHLSMFLFFRAEALSFYTYRILTLFTPKQDTNDQHNIIQIHTASPEQQTTEQLNTALAWSYPSYIIKL